VPWLHPYRTGTAVTSVLSFLLAFLRLVAAESPEAVRCPASTCGEEEPDGPAGQAVVVARAASRARQGKAALEREQSMDGIFSKLLNLLLLVQLFWLVFGSVTVVPSFLLHVAWLGDDTVWASSCRGLANVWVASLSLALQWLLLLIIALSHCQHPWGAKRTIDS
jgi:hypothetical protein